MYMYNCLDLTLVFVCFKKNRFVFSRTVFILCVVILTVQLVGIGIVITFYLRGKLHVILCPIFLILNHSFFASIFFSFSAKRIRTRTGLINACVEETEMNRI